jgi:type I restriction enzyme S subunit
VTTELRLRDLGRWLSGGTPPKDREEMWDGDLPWLSAKDINRDILREPTAFITELAAQRHSQVVAAGSVIVIVRGMALVHGLPVVLTDRRVAFNQDLRALEVDHRLEARFVHYALRGHRHRLEAHIDRAAHGTARVVDSIYRERVRVFARTHQEAIADFLDRECDRVSELAGEISEYQTMISSRWLSAFERSLSRERHTRRLKHFEADLQLGPFGSLLGAAEYVSHGVPVINPMHIHWLGLRPEDGVTVAEEQATSLRRYRLRTGDVVLARRGELGRACVVRGSENGYICGTGSARVRVDPSRLAPEFLVFALMTEPARAHMMLTAVGSTMPNLNAPALLDLRLPDWPVGEQLAAVSAARASWESSAVLMEEVRGTYEALMEYRDALITEAVTGELDVIRLSDRQLDESARAALEGETSEVLAR